MSEIPRTVEVFCSYAHEDEEWLHKLENHLSQLQRQGMLSLWHDQLISAGTEWPQAITSHLETASIILLLISADFLASDYCYSVEMKRSLDRQEAGEARVIPILVRSVDWSASPFAHLQVLPTNAKPLAVWKDKDSALADVVAGIRRVIVEEWNIHLTNVPQGRLPAIWNVPYPRNPFFTAREAELRQVRSFLQLEQVLAQPQAISGLGGNGKTQLVVEYAYRYRQDYQAVLWVQAENKDTLTSSYISLAALLELPERKESEKMIAAIRNWLQTHHHWLLILDNADDLDLLPEYLPTVLGGHLLLTTRATATGQLAHRLEVETLEPESGAVLLLRRAGLIALGADIEQASLQERDLALQISQELGGLPLALDQAGAFLEESGAGLEEYCQIYQEQRKNLLSHRGRLAYDHVDPVTTTWSLSFERVREKDVAAVELLSLCAFLSPDAIAEELLTSGVSWFGPVLSLVAADAFRRNQAIEVLLSYSLIKRDARKKTLSIHRLVQVVLQDSMDQQSRQQWAERAVQATAAAFPDVELANWPKCERLLPHGLVCANLVQQYQIFLPEAARLLDLVGYYLYERARYQEAEVLKEQVVSIYKHILAPNHPDIASSMRKLATIYYMLGKYEEAEPLLKQALDIYEQQKEPEYLLIAQSLNLLALLYQVKGKYEEAEPLYKQALAIYQQQLGSEHPDTALMLSNLAWFYHEQNRYAEAEPLYQHAFAIREQHLDPEALGIAESLNNLAGLYTDQGRHTEAEPLLRRSLTIRLKHLGLEHLETAQVWWWLATAARRQGRHTEAKELYEQALPVFEQKLGVLHYRAQSLRRQYEEIKHNDASSQDT